MRGIHAPVCTRPERARYDLGGATGQYLRAVTEQWLLPTPAANPAILEMFRDRDRLPARDLVPWAGEFAGKYLTSAVQILRLTGDGQLRAHLRAFVADFVACQDDDGYLGPWPRAHRLTGRAPNSRGGSTWDAWGHYHAMLGLLLWHEDSGDGAALASAARIGDLLCARFLGHKRRGRRLVDTGSTEMNLAPAHGLALLYRCTGAARYLDLARQLVLHEFAAVDRAGQPLAGDYLRTGVAGQPFFQTPKPRWESLHPILGMLELYWLTGDEDCRTAFETIWTSIVQLDRHNNGGFSSGEQAQGNPYHPGAIETCCTVAWIAASVEMLRLTGDPLVADELELSTLNSGLGLHSHAGRWVTYNTPMDGVRKASAHDIVFQAREGSPELNCCSVNGPRALGMISDWAVMTGADGLLLNWYGPGRIVVPHAGTMVTLTQATDYPVEPTVDLTVSPRQAADFGLSLRIPRWSERTTVQINGQDAGRVPPGSYLRIERRWQRGDRVQLRFDFRPHRWVGERECRGRTCLYRGPLLLTWDRRYNDHAPDDVPACDLQGLRLHRVEWTGPGPAPQLLVHVAGAGGGPPVRLCDFASAGAAGSPYRTWLRVRHAGRPRAFRRDNPLRTQR